MTINLAEIMNLEEGISSKIAEEMPHFVSLNPNADGNDIKNARSWCCDEFGDPAVNCFFFPSVEAPRKWCAGGGWALWARTDNIFFAFRDQTKAIEFKLRFG